MRVIPLVAALAPRTGKIIHHDHERGENLLFDYTLCLDYANRQKSRW